MGVDLTPAQIDDVANRVKSMRGLAEELGHTYSAVRRAVTKVTGPLRRGAEKGVERPVNEARNQEILRMHAEGVSKGAIARAMKITKQRVGAIIKRGY